MLVEPQNITVLDIYGWAVKRCGAGKNGPFILLCAESFLMMFIPSLSWQIIVSYKLTTQNSRVLQVIRASYCIHLRCPCVRRAGLQWNANGEYDLAVLLCVA